ncbi:uncharacterized protein BO80DRAFT_189305 [Aspergillus ibericus CBS 121593]|uniref:Uncharacterized protein n=1 Tax=Aspergillus ibericus CBS 121593 TaxID=1448316 RepID=A0A395GQ16_9EURO|nr:hypothetical protein BO80DRAFT_189305 [Aspergillus ibericus CBS 121593]RAK97464.1 hypothetical protein BO80DRAFT_189305 [Aspergillus ibericus CBS 121593]
MNGVPGVMTLLSHVFWMTCSWISASALLPFCFASIFRNSSFFSSASLASCAERKRRARCWFIFARGATPSRSRNVHQQRSSKASLGGPCSPPGRCT